ncbi:MAG TPA: small metal-binding protein SmbP, partial [Methylobacter sp.]
IYHPHFNEDKIMKKLAFACAGILLFLSTAVFAEEHTKAALEHANAAVAEGKANKPEALVEHAKLSLEHTLAAAIIAKSVPKGHLDAAAKELQEAIDHGNLDHTDVATKHAEAAVDHIKASSK